MIMKILKRLVNDAVDKRETEMKERMRGEIRLITEDICKAMVDELFAQKKDEEIKNYYWGGREKVETIVGRLKRGIKDNILSDLTSSERERVMSYVNGEDFIDAVIERIRRKQLTRSEI